MKDRFQTQQSRASGILATVKPNSYSSSKIPSRGRSNKNEKMHRQTDLHVNINRAANGSQTPTPPHVHGFSAANHRNRLTKNSIINNTRTNPLQLSMSHSRPSFQLRLPANQGSQDPEPPRNRTPVTEAHKARANHDVIDRHDLLGFSIYKTNAKHVL